jgi:hypothetical protein
MGKAISPRRRWVGQFISGLYAAGMVIVLVRAFAFVNVSGLLLMSWYIGFGAALGCCLYLGRWKNEPRVRSIVIAAGAVAIMFFVIATMLTLIDVA